MTRRKRRAAVPLPVLLTELALASWETIVWRSWMMAIGTCSPAEYLRMASEKSAATLSSALVLTMPLDGDTAAAVLSPWHRKARANAKRLRK